MAKGNKRVASCRIDSSYLFTMIGEKSRLRILHYLLGGSKSVAMLLKQTRLEKTLLSKHLGALRTVGLVTAARSGRNFLYQINPEIIRRAHKNSIFLGCCEIKLKKI